MKRKLDFLQKNAKIGSWSESHDNSGNATDMRIFCTSFTGGSQNNQYAARSLLSAFSATSGLSEKGRKREKKDNRMKNENTANSANNSQYIDLNQPFPQVLFEMYQWVHTQLWQKPYAIPGDYYDGEDVPKSVYNLYHNLLQALVDFKPQTPSDERIKLRVMLTEIEDTAYEGANGVNIDNLDLQDRVAHTIARQLLHR